MKIYLMPAQNFDTLHDLSMCPFTAARFPVGIVNEGGTINAQSQLNVMRLEERTPFIVYQYPVGLHRMNDLLSRNRERRNSPKGFLVKSDGQRKRLTGVPDYTQLVS